VRVLGFVSTVAGLTIAAILLNTFGAAAGLAWVRYAAAVPMLLFPGTVYVRLHPAWRSRVASANAVGVATAAGVFIGILLPELVILALRVARFVEFTPTPRHIVAITAMAVLVPYVTFIVATEAYRKHVSPRPGPRIQRLAPAPRASDQGLLGLAPGVVIRPRLRVRVVALALACAAFAPAVTLSTSQFPWAAESPTAGRLATLIVHTVGLGWFAALGVLVLRQISTRLSADGVSQWVALRRVMLPWASVDRAVWIDGVLELRSGSKRLRILPAFFANAGAIEQAVRAAVAPSALGE
jgi:hypothetical protein